MSADFHEMARDLSDCWGQVAQHQEERLLAKIAAMMDNRRSDVDRDINGNGESEAKARLRTPPVMVNTRLSKVEFPHFWGEDIESWLCKCNSLFEMENTPDNRKIFIATSHLEGPALHWHKRFMRDFAGRVHITWEVYCEHMSVRFMSKHEAPVEELKNLRLTGVVREYTNAFNALLTKVGQLPEEIMFGMFVGGLFLDIRARVRAIRPTDLEEAQQFAQLQEDVSRNPRRTYGGEYKSKSHGDTSRGQMDKSTTFGKQKSPTTEIPFRRLTDKEVAEKKARNECFRCNEKFHPSYKCKQGQFHRIELVPHTENLN